MPVKYLPRPDLPEPILFALQDPYYQEGLNEHFDQIDPKIRKKFEHHFSVTTVARPPRQRVLSKRYSDRVILDPLGDGFWRMFGHTIHSILQEAANRNPVLEAEVRLGTVVKVKVAGKAHQVYIHGQADLYDPRIKMLDDYKITKAESMYYENKDEYIFQLNALAYIWRQNGKPVDAIRNVYLFRNYDPRRYKEGGKYPKEHVAMIDIPIWDDARILKSIEDRVTKHMIAELADDDHLPRCSSAERWESQTSYRAIKIDPKTGEPQKKSKFASEVKMEVHDWIQANSTAADKKGKVTNINYEVREIPGKSVRCDYCEIAAFCAQRQAELRAIMADQDEEEEIPE